MHCMIELACIIFYSEWLGPWFRFTNRLDVYIQDKLLMLNHGAEALREELHQFKLDTFAFFCV